MRSIIGRWHRIDAFTALIWSKLWENGSLSANVNKTSTHTSLLIDRTLPKAAKQIKLLMKMIQGDVIDGIRMHKVLRPNTNLKIQNINGMSIHKDIDCMS